MISCYSGGCLVKSCTNKEMLLSLIMVSKLEHRTGKQKQHCFSGQQLSLELKRMKMTLTLFAPILLWLSHSVIKH